MLADVLLKVAGMEQKPEEPYRPRPSSAGPERCLRQLCYKAHGVKGKKHGDRLVMVLDDSSWHEELSADWIRKTVFKLHHQQHEVKCGITIHKGQSYEVPGHIDGILRDLAEVERLWEHKAINHFSFEKYLKGTYPLDYMTQCALYLKGLQKEYPLIREAVLLIKNKNTSAYLEYLLDYNSATDIMTVKHLIGSDGTAMYGSVEFPNLYRDAFDRYALIEKHRAEGTYPIRQYTLGDWQCDYCPFKEPCFKNYEKEFTESVILTDEAAVMATEYREVSDTISTLKKRQDGLKRALKGYMQSAKASSAQNDRLVLKLSFQTRSYLDENLIPIDVLQKSRQDKTIEALKVIELTQKEEIGK